MKGPERDLAPSLEGPTDPWHSRRSRLAPCHEALSSWQGYKLQVGATVRGSGGLEHGVKLDFFLILKFMALGSFLVMVGKWARCSFFLLFYLFYFFFIIIFFLFSIISFIISPIFPFTLLLISFYLFFLLFSFIFLYFSCLKFLFFYNFLLYFFDVTSFFLSF